MADDGYTFVYQGLGATHDLRGPEDEPRRPLKAILWVPDPEQRHGWREYYVRAPAKEVKRRRPPMGFGAVKRRER